MSAARDDAQLRGDPALEARLAAHEKTEARLRRELAELRDRLQTRTTAQERLAEMRLALSEELRKVREFVVEDGRQAAVESRAMVLAAEAEELRAERDALRERLAALEAERARNPLPTVIPSLRPSTPAPAVTPAAGGEDKPAARLEAARERLRSASAPPAPEPSRDGGSPVKLLRQWIERAQSG